MGETVKRTYGIAILMKADSFIRIYPLTCFDPSKDLVFFILLFNRDEAANGLADYFAGFVAEKLGGRWIPARYGSLKRLAYDRVEGRVDDCCQQTGGVGGRFLRIHCRP